jgi:hypothetical protein
MQSLLMKTVRIAVLSVVAGAAGAIGNMLAMRYIAPVIESKLPSRVSEEQDTPPRAPSAPGYPAR